MVSGEYDRLRPGPDAELVEQFETWLRTVFSLIARLWPMSALASPWVINASTSRSRAVRRAKAGSSPRGAARPMKSRTTS